MPVIIIAVIRRNCDLPYIGTVIEQRRSNFVNSFVKIVRGIRLRAFI